MIKKIPASERYIANHDWLKTYHLFSFADYYDPANMNFGELRVFNDDTIAGQSGFGAHSHANMEIVTIVFEGVLTHQDSMGNNGTIKPGEVQYMSAGTGVTHAELNQGDETVKLYQIWMMPRTQGLTPQYNQKSFGNTTKNTFTPLTSGFADVLKTSDAIEIQSDTTIYSIELEPNTNVEHVLPKNHGLFIYVASGSIQIGETEFSVGDQARITGEESIKILSTKNGENTKFIAIETLV